jgi:dihydropteroate synthase
MTVMTKIGNQEFFWGQRTYVMGIINVTPDSFSGDGLLSRDRWIASAVDQAEMFTQFGADIVDIGGESTRPGATPVATDEEIERVVPVIAAITRRVDVPISIDTYKAAVARAALDAGAHMVNDVWGLRADSAMAPLCAERNVPVVIMHNRSKPRNAIQEERLGGRYIGTEYKDLIGDINDELTESVNLALDTGISPHNIIIDPGIGFGKTVKQNLTLLHNLDKFKVMGYPLLLGPSNKSFIGYTLDLPADDRVEGTAATIAIGIDRGADIIRVHQVKQMVRIAKMTDAIVRR